MNKAVFLVGLIGLCSCGPWQELQEVLDPDVLPPVLLGVQVADSCGLELVFDEELRSPPESLRIDPELAVVRAEALGPLLRVQVSPQEPGRRYVLEATVADVCGNRLSFLAEFYGFNPRVPRLVINEFTTRGTGNHPDMAELKACGDGDMGGVVLYQGTPSSYDDRLVFPSFPIRAGEFVLVHFKPQGIPEEIDETQDPAASGGLDAAETAFDFWIAGGSGLSGNNGAISLYSSPGGKLIDGVLYSNRTAASDELYGGFGTATAWERAQELVRDGGWGIAGARATPEEAVNPEGSTGTRSLCRDSGSSDTDSRLDWHIVPTLGFTFGQDNSEEVYMAE